MSWIRMTVVGAALCAVASVAEAQGPPAGAPTPGSGMGGGAGHGRMQAMMFQGISLSTAQQAAITAISDKAATDRKAHMPAGGASGPRDPARKKMMKEMQAKHHAELRAVLTADQQKRFDANIAAMQTRRQKRTSAPQA